MKKATILYLQFCIVFVLSIITIIFTTKYIQRKRFVQETIRNFKEKYSPQNQQKKMLLSGWKMIDSNEEYSTFKKDGAAFRIYFK